MTAVGLVGLFLIKLSGVIGFSSGGWAWPLSIALLALGGSLILGAAIYAYKKGLFSAPPSSPSPSVSRECDFSDNSTAASLC